MTRLPRGYPKPNRNSPRAELAQAIYDTARELRRLIDEWVSGVGQCGIELEFGQYPLVTDLYIQSFRRWRDQNRSQR